MNMNRSKLAGIVVPNIIFLVITGIIKFITYSYAAGSDIAPILIASNFILLPIIMGIVSAYHWQNLNLSTKQRLGISLYTFGIALFFAAFFMGEGYICLLIISPL